MLFIRFCMVLLFAGLGFNAGAVAEAKIVGPVYNVKLYEISDTVLFCVSSTIASDDNLEVTYGSKKGWIMSPTRMLHKDYLKDLQFAG